jgi:hypothetical protein
MELRIAVTHRASQRRFSKSRNADFEKSPAAAEPLYRIKRHHRQAIGFCEDCVRTSGWAWDARRWVGHPFHLTPAEWGTEDERARSIALAAQFGWESDGLCRCSCSNSQLETDWIQDLYRLGQVSDGDLHSACQGCGRTLGRVNFDPAKACSTECARVAHNVRRRVDTQPAECETCGGTFTPPRADARYCSPACRQKAYRQRLRRH